MINCIVIDHVINNKIKGWLGSNNDEPPIFDIEIQDNITADKINVDVSTSVRGPKKFNFEITADLKEIDLNRLNISVKTEGETLKPKISNGLRIANNLRKMRISPRCEIIAA